METIKYEIEALQAYIARLQDLKDKPYIFIGFDNSFDMNNPDRSEIGVPFELQKDLINDALSSARAKLHFYLLSEVI